MRAVITYFDKYPLMGVKSLDFQDFKTVYSLILTKQHLTDLGREEIKQIVASLGRAAADAWRGFTPPR